MSTKIGRSNQLISVALIRAAGRLLLTVHTRDQSVMLRREPSNYLSEPPRRRPLFWRREPLRAQLFGRTDSAICIHCRQIGENGNEPLHAVSIRDEDDGLVGVGKKDRVFVVLRAVHVADLIENEQLAF